MPLGKDHGGWSDRGYLPHRDEGGLKQSVTFRLADSFPSDKRDEWEKLFAICDDEDRLHQIEEWLDKGAGSCALREPEAASIVQEALLFFHEQRYRLIAWCIMPNHVHVLFETFEGHPLGRVIHSWKTFTAREINRLRGTHGSLWQEDYFDRYIRDDRHLHEEIRYIENNPVAAHLVKKPEDWPFSSAGYRE
jgi:putative transposase